MSYHDLEDIALHCLMGLVFTTLFGFIFWSTGDLYGVGDYVLFFRLGALVGDFAVVWREFCQAEVYVEDGDARFDFLKGKRFWRWGGQKRAETWIPVVVNHVVVEVALYVVAH